MNRLLYLALRSPQRELRGWAVRALRELACQPLARPVLLHAGALEALALAPDLQRVIVLVAARVAS